MIVYAWGGTTSAVNAFIQRSTQAILTRGGFTFWPQCEQDAVAIFYGREVKAATYNFMV
jgi:hypothetical protein